MLSRCLLIDPWISVAWEESNKIRGLQVYEKLSGLETIKEPKVTNLFIKEHVHFNQFPSLVENVLFRVFIRSFGKDEIEFIETEGLK